MTLARPALVAILVGGAAAPAAADVQDWEVNEILVSADGDPAIQYLELRNLAGGCLFPSSRVEVFDAAGSLLGAVAPAQATTCYGAPTFFLLATTEAAAFFGTSVDESLTVTLPAGAGQVCFASSSTRYDCVRWGAVTSPIEDFFGPDDQTSAEAPPDGAALARIDVTHVVEQDWELAEPTPRAFNDGSPWSPPDAGPTPDAGPLADAAPPPDAGPRSDAGRPPDAAPPPDARNDRFLDLVAGGGASCGCQQGTGPDPLALLLLALAAAPLRRRAPFDRDRQRA